MYTKQDIKLPEGNRERRQFLVRHRRIVFLGFFPLLFFLALVAVPWVTVQGVAPSNKPVSQAGLMFNEDDSHWLLITAMSPNTDTFNTARHSRCFAQCQEDYQQLLTCTSAQIHKRMQVLRLRLHVYTHPQPEAKEALRSSSLAVAWLRWSRRKIRRPDPFRVLI